MNGLDTNPFLSLLSQAENFRSGYEGYRPLSISNSRLNFGPLPSLTPNATDFDKNFYNQIQSYYNQLLQSAPDAETGSLESGFFPTIDREPFANAELNARSGGIEGLNQYNDPNIREYVKNLIYNATLQDTPESWLPFQGNMFADVLTLFGLAVGGAGAYGGFGSAGAGSAGAGLGSTLPAEFTAPAIASSGLTPSAGLAVGEGTLATVAPSAGSSSLLSGLQNLGQTPLLGIQGAPTYGQTLTGLNLANSAANVAQNPSVGGGLGIAGAGISAATGVPGLSTLGSGVGGAIDSATSSQSNQSSPPGGNKVAEESGGTDLGQLLSLAPYLGLLGSSLGSGGFFPSQQTALNKSYDPVAQFLNLLRQSQTQGAVDATGGFSSLLANDRPEFQLSPWTQGIQQSLINRSQAPGLSPQDWYSQIDSSLKDNLYYNQGNNQNIFNAGSQRLNQRNQADLSANQNLLPFGQNYFEQLVAPTLQNQFALSGLGRSGAIQEALAKAGAQIALPLAQQQSAQDIALRQQGYQGQLGLENLLSGQQSSLGTQYAQNLYGAQQQYPNVDIALNQAPLERLGIGLNASDLPRQLQAQRYTNQLQSLLGLVGNAPFKPTENFTTTQSGNVFANNLFPYLGTQGTLAAAGKGNIFSSLAGGLGSLLGSKRPSSGDIDLSNFNVGVQSPNTGSSGDIDLGAWR